MPKHEPPRPVLVGERSLVHAPTVGERAAPEVLIFELFRELATGRNSSADSAERSSRKYSDVLPELTLEERVLLEACRGREKVGRPGRVGVYYAPPYAFLAERAWFRKGADRALRSYFLQGPLAHFHKCHQRDFDLQLVVNSVLGGRSAPGADDCKGKEVLSLLALSERLASEPSSDQLLGHLEEAVKDPKTAPLGRHEDPLGSTIGYDFLEVCHLEGQLPRREWLYFLGTFLRIATSCWLLAQLRITVYVRDWISAALMGEEPPHFQEVLRVLRERYRGLLHPTSSPTREVSDHVEQYMRARVELSVLATWLGEVAPDRLSLDPDVGVVLKLDETGGKNIELLDLLSLAGKHRRTVGGQLGGIRQPLIRESEKASAWRSPRKVGQGKNVDEFLRVLYWSKEDDSGGALLRRLKGPGLAGSYTIEPGHRLLQLFAHLARMQKEREAGGAGAGKLVLRDIEAHLYRYGIDFRSTAYGRPLLIERLTEYGLLRGSPDAGESAEIRDVVNGR